MLQAFLQGLTLTFLRMLENLMCTKRRLKLRYAQLVLKCYSALTGLVLLDNFYTYCLNPAKAVLKKDQG